MSNNLLNSLKVVASAYGDKMGINVIPSNAASTDGSTIYTVIDEENPRATWGFLKHEAAHILETDFEVFKNLRDYLNSKPGLIEKGVTFEHLLSVFNALEDNRIEYKFYKKYNGAHNTFNSMNLFLIERSLWSFSAEPCVQSAAFQFINYYAAGNPKGLNYTSCTDLSRNCDDLLKATVNIELYEKLSSMVLSSVFIESTLDVVYLSINILEVLTELNIFEFSETLPKIVDKGDLIGAELTSSSTKEFIYDMDSDSSSDCNVEISKDCVNRYQKGVDASSVLISKIKHILKARSRDTHFSSKKGRRISNRNLSKIPSGFRNVFKLKKEGRSSTTALYITVDISGSMKNKVGNSVDTRLDLALQSASALIHAVGQVKTSDFCLSVFNRSAQVIKRFNSKSSAINDTIDRLTPTGGTCLFPTLECGIKSLSTVRHLFKRKVMIIITDGLPSDYEKSIRYIEDIRSSGVEVYSFGINLTKERTLKMTKLFGKDFIDLSDPLQLRTEVVKLGEIIL